MPQSDPPNSVGHPRLPDWIVMKSLKEPERADTKPRMDWRRIPRHLNKRAGRARPPATGTDSKKLSGATGLLLRDGLPVAMRLHGLGLSTWLCLLQRKGDAQKKKKIEPKPARQGQQFADLLKRMLQRGLPVEGVGARHNHCFERIFD